MSRTALWTCGLAVSVVGLGAVWIFNRKKEDQRALKDRRDSHGENMIWSEQVVRTRQFFGEEGQRDIENSYVIVVGVGGVGVFKRKGVHGFVMQEVIPRYRWRETELGVYA